MSDKPSPVKNMAFWNAKNGPAAASPNKFIEKLGGLLKGANEAKGAADELTGKKDLNDAMKKPIKES